MSDILSILHHFLNISLNAPFAAAPTPLFPLLPAERERTFNIKNFAVVFRALVHSTTRSAAAQQHTAGTLNYFNNNNFSSCH